MNLTAGAFPKACRGVSERIQMFSPLQIEESPPLAAGRFNCSLEKNLFRRAKVISLIVCCCGILAFVPKLSAQGGGGLETPFAIGVGAKFMGLGNAAAAFPDDPTAFFWNPGAMGVSEEKRFGLSYTSFSEGVQYHSLGYVHPTLNSGTMGVGVNYIGIRGISQWEYVQGVPMRMGEFGWWWGQFSVAYATPLAGGFSMGAGFSAHRQVYGEMDSYNGFGLDIGVHYRFQADDGLLKNLYIGCAYFNVVSRMNLTQSQKSLPRSLRAGLAKGFFLRNGADRLMLLADYEKPEFAEQRFHAGIEYRLQKLACLRMGYDNDRMTFGCGLRLKGVQLDYAARQFGDKGLHPQSHRFSLVFHIGRSIPEQIRFAELRKQQEIQRRTQEQVEADRRVRIQECISAGKKYLEAGEYFNARLEFGRALRDDPSNQEVQSLLDETGRNEQALLKKREDELVQAAREREQRELDNVFINQRFNEGLEAMSKEEFQRAIEKWTEALQKDPGNQQIQNYIQSAKTELERKVNASVAEARRLIAQEKHSEAYKVLEKARVQSEGDPVLKSRIDTEIRGLDRTVDFISNYQAGLQRYQKGRFDEAAAFLKKAVDARPDDGRAQDLYRNAVARSAAKTSNAQSELQGEALRQFQQGLEFYRKGQYEDALNIWQEALKKEPHNIKLLEAIQTAKDKLEIYRKP